jgi:hypothetical protein
MDSSSVLVPDAAHQERIVTACVELAEATVTTIEDAVSGYLHQTADRFKQRVREAATPSAPGDAALPAELDTGRSWSPVVIGAALGLIACALLHGRR